ncbi:MAG: diphthamide biosynthesis enzyme Dph2 [Candidatus Hydrothermarchaeaceae archaeon]
MHDLEIDRIVKIIKDRRYRVIGLQLPEGLKDSATEIADTIRDKTGCDVVISADPCYGACDLADSAMKRIGADALFHFGHSPMFEKGALPVEYMPVQSDSDPVPLIRKHLDRFSKRVGLVTTIQHVHTLEKVKRLLEEEGFVVKIGKGGGRIKHDGQVLGCSFVSAVSVADDVDSFIYIGSGNFHPLGVALATGKRTFAVDPLLREVRDMGPLKEKILRQRHARIAKARQGGTFGIIIGEKRGQMRKGLAFRLKKLIEGKGKRAYLLYLREITPENLLPFRKLDAFVNTACPRVSIDDAARFKRPLLTPVELEIVLGERGWGDYTLDEMS